MECFYVKICKYHIWCRCNDIHHILFIRMCVFHFPNMYVDLWICIYIHTHSYLKTCMCILIVFMFLFTYLYHKHMRVNVCVYDRVCVCLYVCMLFNRRIYACTYIRTDREKVRGMQIQDDLRIHLCMPEESVLPDIILHSLNKMNRQ